MRKRILSLLLCIVMCLSLMPMSAFAVERTIAPVNNSANDMWLTADGMLHWKDTGSSSYTIRIFQHPGSVALETIPVDSGVTEYNLYAFLDSEKYAQRDYRIEISGHSDNIIIHYVSPFEKLSAPTNLRWNGNVAEWDSVSGADEYGIYLYNSAGAYVTYRTTTETSFDWSYKSPEDGWFFEVVAKGTNYRNSEVIESPKYGNTTPQPGTYTVTFDANGGTGNMASETLTPDTDGFVKNYTFPECGFTAPAGKEFDKWEATYTSGSNVGYSWNPNPEESPWLYGSITVKAIWKDTTTPQPGTYTVTYDANGGTGTMAQETFTPDGSGFVKNFTVPECGFTAPAGQEFDHWENSNGTPYQVGGTPWIAESMILKAIWKDTTIPQPGTITVTYDANGGTGTMAQETYTLDSEGWVKNFTVPECRFTAPAGKEFDRWEDANGTPYQVGGTPWIAESMILKAIWKDSTTPQPTTYTVTFNMGDHGTAPIDQEVIAGGNATKPTTDPTAEGWTFGGWYADATFSVEFDFNTAITANTTIYAKWTENSVTPPSPVAYTIIAGANGEWTKGSSAGLAFTSDAPFAKFDSVKVDSTTIAASNYTASEGSTKITLAPAYLETLSVGSHSIVVVSTDGTASTNFTVKAAAQPSDPTTYKVTFDMGGHGTAPADQTVYEGSKATKPTDPTASGYTFGGWYADATFSAKFDFNTAITANTTVYAKWTKNSVAPTDPTSPQTGDNSHMFLWIALLFVSGGALVGTTVYGKKRKRAE